MQLEFSLAGPLLRAYVDGTLGVYEANRVELLRDVFGEDKLPVRMVLGVANLPLGVPVVLEVLFEIEA